MSKVDIMKLSDPQPKSGFKRMLKFGSKTKAVKQLITPPSSQEPSPLSSRTPSSNSSCINEPATGLLSLQQKYGKPTQTLGDGATGTVQAFINPRDGSVVAIKKFRCEKSLADDKTYAKRITNEFNIGSELKHGNIIKTLEVIKEGRNWYQVMEYAPVELYELAESRIMSMEEMHCAWTQILEGAAYLHRMGIAHRDLKLENVVMTEEGIMKIVDFGSAISFKNASSGSVVLARGYVGCEPYMAPEIFAGNAYDPRAVDVWCLAIMYYSLILSRFPWSSAQQTDPTFRSFSKPTSTCHGLDEFSQNSTTGPASVLKELPSESRLTIKGMLQLTPSRRLSVRQVLQQPWVKRLDVCCQDLDGTVHRAKDHEHPLVTESLSPSTSRNDVSMLE